ncbi:sodium/proline symporter PutP [Desulfoluna butyratoxydans]|uniref:sodium/proline symporter PutP n=1 Tax=Desulfoluna butyratoxydans TaxID=231438 RepID=UPI001C5554C2|nr:sodium/proline symporter PutP [Desulfoluna butyratoxydans]
MSILISFVLYLIFMVGIGWVYYGRTKTLSDYILGGRGLNSWVGAMSAQASDMSGWLLLGLPGYAYVAGLESFWIAFGLAMGTWLNWKFVAERLRNYTEMSGDSITLPDYFENRFRDTSHLLRIISAIFILIFFLIYTASGFVAGAKLFSTVFGLSYNSALLIGVAVIISYTFLGGFMAVSWTDFFQGMIMIVAIIVVPTLGIIKAGGLATTLDGIRSINPAFLSIFTDTKGAPLAVMSVISLAAWGLGYFGQPHILARFMAIRTTAEIRKAKTIAMLWVVASLSFAVVVGLVGLVCLDVPLAAGDQEKIFMVMVDQLVPTVLAGVFLAAILAAIMSTADSQLLVTSSALTEDFYKVLFRKEASDAELVWVSRCAVMLVAVFAWMFARNPDSSVLGLVSYAWAGFGATFGPIILLSLYWKRMTRNGALAGIVAGGVTVIVWKQLTGGFLGLFDLYEIVPGFLVSIVVIVAVSLMDKEPAHEIQAEFDAVNNTI